MVGEQIYIDRDLSGTGSETPKAHSGLEKDPDHRSSIYGDFVDRGRVVRSGVSTHIDPRRAPRLRWRIDEGFCGSRHGVGMHGQPARLCGVHTLRASAWIAPAIYQR